MINIVLDTKKVDEIFSIIKKNIMPKIGKDGTYCDGEKLTNLNIVNNYFASLGMSQISLERLITMPFEEILYLNEKIKASDKVNYPCKKIKTDGKHIKHPKAFEILYRMYDKISKDDKLEINNTIGLNVCPYCNRNYINSRKTRTAHFDHFFPRSKYPIFAVSIYNLVPCCAACNTIKRDKEITVSPYSNGYNFDTNIRFSFIPKTAEFVTQKEAIAVDIQSITEEGIPDIESNLKELEIRLAYTIHNTDISNIISKNYVYNESYLASLRSEFGNIFKSEVDILNLLYDTNQDYYNEPLAKLKNDIMEELGIKL